MAFCDSGLMQIGRRLFLFGAGAGLTVRYALPSTRSVEPSRTLDALIAAARGRAGAAALQFSPNLARAAQVQAQALAQGDFLTHGVVGAATPPERAAQAGYDGQVLGEVLSLAPDDDPQPVLAAWLEVTETRAVLLHPDIREIGLAWSASADGYVRWSVMVGVTL